MAASLLPNVTRRRPDRLPPYHHPGSDRHLRQGLLGRIQDPGHASPWGMLHTHTRRDGHRLDDLTDFLTRIRVALPRHRRHSDT